DVWSYHLIFRSTFTAAWLGCQRSICGHSAKPHALVILQEALCITPEGETVKLLLQIQQW
ncbi:hypothetical protein, partial [Desulfopila aestuarii]|uniref:hypothetical protein n=1 Tax=Desulfopila aestuarii TaxID=231440 RepID=UPI001F3E8AE5